MNTIDTEVRLTEALSAQADAISDSAPPRFSWQLSVADAAQHRNVTLVKRRRRALIPALKFALPAAVAAAVVITALVDSGSGSTNSVAQGSRPSTPISPVAFLQPGGIAPMKPGQYFYRKDVSVAGTDGTRLVVELWQPQDISGLWVVKTYRTTADGAMIGAVNEQTAACGQFLRLASGATTCDLAGSWSQPTPKFLATLPTDPHALYAQLYDYILADYRLSGGDRGLDFSQSNLAFLTINYISGIASSAGGMSEPFSKALQGATALVPGVVVKPNATSLAGVSGTSYEIDYTATNIAGPLIFDAAGNYVGSPTSAVSLGTADSAGGAPTIS